MGIQNAMKIISIITLCASAIYLFITFATFGVLSSISESRYRWLNRGYSEAFTIFCTLVAAGAIGLTFYELKDITRLLFALAGFFMFCVSIASLFKEKKVSTMHYLFSIGAIALGFAALSVQYWGNWKSWVPLVVFIVLSLITRKAWPDIATTIIECLALLIIFTII